MRKRMQAKLPQMTPTTTGKIAPSAGAMSPQSSLISGKIQGIGSISKVDGQALTEN